MKNDSDICNIAVNITNNKKKNGEIIMGINREIECVEMLNVLKDQMRNAPNNMDTLIEQVNPNSFKFVIDEAIKIINKVIADK